MDEIEALRQQLRDEFARRAFVEETLAAERAKLAIWRRRAEERAARIERLVAERDGGPRRTGARARLDGVLARARGRSAPGPAPTSAPAPADAAVPTADEAAPSVTSSAGPAPDGAGGAVSRPAGRSPVPGEPPARGRPAHPEVTIGHALRRADDLSLVAEASTMALTDGRRALVDVDVVAVDWSVAPPGSELATALAAWVVEPARPPLLHRGPVPDAVATHLRATDVALDALAVRWPATPAEVTLPPRAQPLDVAVREDGSLRLQTAGGRPVAARADRDADVAEVLAHVARGVPVCDDDGGWAPQLTAALGPDAVVGDLLPPLTASGTTTTDALRRTAVQQRRELLLAAAPARALEAVLDELGVAWVPVRTATTALLASNRPARVPTAIARLAAQRRAFDEVLVALHGGATADERRAVEAALAGLGVPTVVTAPPTSRTLGAMLNDLAAAASSPCLAKIDDDDHYGPSYLLDQLLSLEHSGADVVGKATHYVHAPSADTTWLLRPGHEEQPLTAGILPGATMVLRRGALDLAPFPDRPRRVDSLLVRAGRTAGLTFHSGVANDFAYLRGADGHTNPASDARWEAVGHRVADGLPLDVIDV